MPVSNELHAPSWPWRAASGFTIATIGALSKAFLTLACKTKVHGLESFVQILDERKDPEKRERGLITVSNHLSVVDDPVTWGILPLRYLAPTSTRYSLGSADICFKNGPYSPVSQLFTLGQTLPTNRHHHSPYGGLYQPTITQCIRLLSQGPFETPIQPPEAPNSAIAEADPFTNDSITTYTANNLHYYPSPSAYAINRHAWIHIYPEGRIHQHPDHRMRYFKWGIARLILESDPCPDVVPMFISGFANVMHEERQFPRFLPRVGHEIDITFGSKISRDTLEAYRSRWQAIKKKYQGNEAQLRYGDEARLLRIEMASFVRGEIQKLREERGWPADDPKGGLVETWIEEGEVETTPGKKPDGSIVGNA